MTAPSPQTILEAVDFVAHVGLCGLVWLDEQLCAIERLGALADFVPLTQSVTETVPPLLGLDDAIRALQHAPHATVEVPNVRFSPARRDAPRINLTIYWLAQRRRYLLMITRAPATTTVELMLAAEVRARAIAEADAAAKARIIARTNEELAHANRDLQDYASIVSHDLRAPLRALRYFAEDAAVAIENARADAALAALERIHQQSRRMASMLSDLLDYSSIGRKQDTIETVDTAALIGEIVASCKRTTPLHIETDGRWPTLQTLRQPLDIVVRNLVDNAVKHHDRTHGKIIVRGQDDGPFQTVTIIDDGPGIPPEWHEAIFAPFKRIADDDTAEGGSGIGLALVKKTVDRLGGSVTVSSNPTQSRGTTFVVQWPKTIPRGDA